MSGITRSDSISSEFNEISLSSKPCLGKRTTSTDSSDYDGIVITHDAKRSLVEKTEKKRGPGKQFVGHATTFNQDLLAIGVARKENGYDDESIRHEIKAKIVSARVDIEFMSTVLTANVKERKKLLMKSNSPAVLELKTQSDYAKYIKKLEEKAKGPITIARKQILDEKKKLLSLKTEFEMKLNAVNNQILLVDAHLDQLSGNIEMNNIVLGVIHEFLIDDL